MNNAENSSHTCQHSHKNSNEEPGVFSHWLALQLEKLKPSRAEQTGLAGTGKSHLATAIGVKHASKAKELSFSEQLHLLTN